MNRNFIGILVSIASLSAIAAGPGGQPPGGGTQPGGNQPGSGGSSATWTFDSFLASSETTSGIIIREGVITGYESPTSATLSSSVTEIAAGALAGCTTLTSIDLSACSSLTEIPDSAFAGCTALKTVTLPASCTAIGPNAFAGCTALATFTGTGVAAVSHDAFRDCTALASKSATATEIGSYAYSHSGVTSVDLSGVTTLGEGAFASCESLTAVTVATSATLPAAAFAGCTALATGDWSNVAEFGQAALAGIPAAMLTVSSDAAVGAYVFAADESTVVTTLSALPASYDADTSFLGRETSYTVNGSDVVRIEANELVTWLMAVAKTPLENTTVAQPTSDGTTVCYATAFLETWLSDSSNEAALLAYCYGDGTAATDVLAVDGGTQSFVFEPSGKSAVSVSIVGTNDLAVDFDVSSLSGTDNGDGTYTYVSADDTATSCFARLKFAKDW